MKKPKVNMDSMLKAVGIIVAAGGLVSAIFDKDKTQELSKELKDMQKRIDILENK